MQENAVHARYCQNNGIGSGTVLVRDQSPCPVFCQEALNHPAEDVAADFPQQPHIIPQQFQRKAGVCHTAARMNAGGIHADQSARNQQIADPVITVSRGKNRRNIQTDMSGRDDFAHESFSLQNTACHDNRPYKQSIRFP